MTKHDSKTADELILENAPDSATHYCCGTYCKANKDFFYDWDGEYWCAYFVPDGYIRSLADITELVELRKKNAELEKKLNPELFWDASNTEVSHDSIEELMHLKFEDGAQVGDEVEIQRAALLPNEMYIFTEINDEDYSCEYVLKGGDL